MFKKTSLFLVMAFSCIGFSQNEDLFKRLRAIENNNITFYNVDGLAFTKEAIPSHFNEKNLKKPIVNTELKKSSLKRLIQYCI